MSTCKKCGKTYYTRECLNCKDMTDTEIKNMNKKKINIPLIIITISIVIIATILMKREYEEYQATQMFKQAFYGTTNNDKIEKINNNFMKTTKKMQREMNMQNKAAMEQINDMNKNVLKAMKQINQEFKYTPQKYEDNK